MGEVISVREDRWNGLVYKRVQQTVPKIKQHLRKDMFAYLRDLKTEANREILRKPKSGRTYIIRTPGGRRKRHVASAPGESHANLSGATRRSLSWKVFGWDRAQFGYGVSTNASNVAPVWAPYLEGGTRNAAARPSIGNAVRAVPPSPHFQVDIVRIFR